MTDSTHLNWIEVTSVKVLLESKPNSTSVFSIDPDASIIDAAKILKDRGVGILMVKNKDQLVGVLSERDFVTRWIATENFPKAIKVKDLMSTSIDTVGVLDTVFDCYLRFVARKCRHLPVVDPKGDVVGVLSLRDVADYVIGALRG